METFDEQTGDFRAWCKMFTEVLWDIELVSDSLEFITFHKNVFS